MDNLILGGKIVFIRPMTQKEATEEGWDLGRNNCMILVLDNGVKLYASQDYEGNGPGALFFTKDGKCYAI